MYKVVQCLFKARKRKREGCIEGSQKAQRVEEDVEHAEAFLHPAESEDFLEMVSDGTRRRCHLAFQTATADYVVHPIVCAVCAGENDIGDHPDALQQVVIGNMPNPALLHPHIPHTVHQLFGGILLEPKGLSRDCGGVKLVNVCQECWSDLIVV